MHEDFRQTSGASAIELIEVIQKLRSGYGAILRDRLSGAQRKPVVVKHVRSLPITPSVFNQLLPSRQVNSISVRPLELPNDSTDIGQISRQTDKLHRK